MPDAAVSKAQLSGVPSKGTVGASPPFRIFGEGEMAEIIREFGWERTPLGRIETWSETLVTTVNLLLASKHPMFLWWGPDLIQFYNDSYKHIIAVDKHPAALGQGGKECWPEIWPIIGPQIEKVMAQGDSIFQANQMVPTSRNGRLEEAFWTYSYSPVRGGDGRVEGNLVVCTETTEQVLSERRLQMLLTIKEDTLAETQPTESRQLLSVVQAVAKSLGSNPADLPFAALYLLDVDGVIQAGSCGANGPLADPSRWPLAKLTNSQKPLLLEDLHERFADLVCQPWPEPVTRAYLLPFCVPGSASYAVLVLGISPRLPFDAGYETFFSLVGTRVTSILQNEVLQLERMEEDEGVGAAHSGSGRKGSLS